MSLAALEYAALAPRRFVELLHMNVGHNDILDPVKIRVISLHPTKELKMFGALTVGEIDDFRVAPGGRYLIVTSKHSMGAPENKDLHIFTLWDIGFTHFDKPKVLGRMKKVGDRDSPEACRLHDLYFDTNVSQEKQQELFLIFSSVGSDPNVVYMYKIILSPSSTPVFTKCFERPIPDRCTLVVSRELNRIVGHFGQTGHHFFVWDFDGHRGVSWHGLDCSFDVDLDIVLHPFQDTLIVANHSKDIMVYNIPSMTSLESSKHLTLSAALVVKNPLSGSDPHGCYSLGCSKYSSYTHNRPFICVSNPQKLFIYQVKDIASISDPTIPKNLPVNLGYFDLDHERSSEYVYFNFLDNMDEDYLIMSHISDDWFNVWVSVFALDQNGIPLDMGTSRSLADSMSVGYRGSVEMKNAYICSASDTQARLRAYALRNHGGRLKDGASIEEGKSDGQSLEIPLIVVEKV